MEVRYNDRNRLDSRFPYFSRLSNELSNSSRFMENIFCGWLRLVLWCEWLPDYLRTVSGGAYAPSGTLSPVAFPTIKPSIPASSARMISRAIAGQYFKLLSACTLITVITLRPVYLLITCINTQKTLYKYTDKGFQSAYVERSRVSNTWARGKKKPLKGA